MDDFEVGGARFGSRLILGTGGAANLDALERAIDTHLGNLRKKLEAAGMPEIIQTVRGMGFRLWLE